MSRFITRVELHAATYQDYEILHDAMKEQKFYRTIQDSNTKEVFHLPTAEYWSQSEALDQKGVLELAEFAAKKTGKKYSIVVTKSGGITFVNLAPAKVMV